MKIGTRVTLVLLASVTPLLAVYMYVSILESTQVYVEDLKREARATTRALEAALAPDIAQQDWPSVGGALERIRPYDVEAAVLSTDGAPRFVLPEFPLRPIPTIPNLQTVHTVWLEQRRHASWSTSMNGRTPRVGTVSR